MRASTNSAGTPNTKHTVRKANSGTSAMTILLIGQEVPQNIASTSSKSKAAILGFFIVVYFFAFKFKIS